MVGKAHPVTNRCTLSEADLPSDTLFVVEFLCRHTRGLKSPSDLFSNSSFAYHTHPHQQINKPRKEFRNQSWKDLRVKSSIPLSSLGQPSHPLSPFYFFLCLKCLKPKFSFLTFIPLLLVTTSFVMPTNSPLSFADNYIIFSSSLDFILLFSLLVSQPLWPSSNAF